MTQRCYVCNKYFYDTIDLINHMKESHKTHSFTALIKYFESKLQRVKSFADKDISYLMSYDMEKIIDRIITLEASFDVTYNEEITDLRTRIINMEMKPEIVCASGTEKGLSPLIQKLEHEVNSLKSLVFSSTSLPSDIPLVPMGGFSQQQIDDRLKWLTHTDKRRGSQMVKTGYEEFHEELMEELAPILERRYWELE